MKTLIINGSPKEENGNTAIFIKEFLAGTGNDYEIRCSMSSDPQELARYLEQFDAVLFFFPLYVHSMPGNLQKVVEEMRLVSERKYLGFIEQHGFVEAKQSEYLQASCKQLAKRLGYCYLGYVTRGNAAGVYMMPETANKELFQQLRQLGKVYAKTNTFDQHTVRELATPYKVPRSMKIVSALKLDKIMWKRMLKSNRATEIALDRPFLEKS